MLAAQTSQYILTIIPFSHSMQQRVLIPLALGNDILHQCNADHPFKPAQGVCTKHCYRMSQVNVTHVTPRAMKSDCSGHAGHPQVQQCVQYRINTAANGHSSQELYMHNQVLYAMAQHMYRAAGVNTSYEGRARCQQSLHLGACEHTSTYRHHHCCCCSCAARVAWLRCCQWRRCTPCMTAQKANKCSPYFVRTTELAVLIVPDGARASPTSTNTAQSPHSLSQAQQSTGTAVPGCLSS